MECSFSWAARFRRLDEAYKRLPGAAVETDPSKGRLAVFRLRTLGGTALERDGVTLDTLGAQRKTLALLTLLAASRSQGISRERLAAYLWPESDTERARGALKQALHVARRQLGSAEAILGTAELRLNRSYIESDVGAFLGALEEGKLDVAANLYGGPFLDGFYLPGAPEFEEWVSAKRDEFARRYASALERLASAAEARGDSAAAIEWLRRLQSTDPLSARVTLRLMRALEAAGERGAALRCAQTHEALLREELDSPPDPEVAALAARLREEPVRLEPARPPAPPQPVSAPSEEVPPVAPAPTEIPHPARTEASTPRFRSSYIAVAVAFAAIVLAVALFVTDQRGGPGGEAPGVSVDRSVAVLPFANMSGDSATNHLADGLTDELADALSSVQGLPTHSHDRTETIRAQCARNRGFTRCCHRSQRVGSSQWRPSEGERAPYEPA